MSIASLKAYQRSKEQKIMSLDQIRKLAMAEAEKYLEAEKPKMRAEIGDMIITVAAEVLNVEWGFGAKRLKQFSDRMISVLECKQSGNVTIEEIKENFRRIYGIEIGLEEFEHEKRNN